jgi:acetyl-CoA acetyltransferase
LHAASNERWQSKRTWSQTTRSHRLSCQYRSGRALSGYCAGSSYPKGAQKANLKVEDLDLMEINEAFASVALKSINMLGIDPEKVNVNGGAIALGHPIGASGARILLTLAKEMESRGAKLGAAAICSGTGQGDCVILSREGLD